MIKTKGNANLINFILTLFLICIDQFSKFLAVTYLQAGPKTVIKGIFELNYVQNTGAAFGIMQNFRMFFLVMTPIVLIILLIYLIKNKNNKLYSLSLVLIIAGAVGNYIDRVRLGYVIDFLDFKIWPVFNFADTLIVTGAALFALILFIQEYREKSGEGKKNDSAN